MSKQGWLDPNAVIRPVESSSPDLSSENTLRALREANKKLEQPQSIAIEDFNTQQIVMREKSVTYDDVSISDETRAAVMATARLAKEDISEHVIDGARNMALLALKLPTLTIESVKKVSDFEEPYTRLITSAVNDIKNGMIKNDLNGRYINKESNDFNANISFNTARLLKDNTVFKASSMGMKWKEYYDEYLLKRKQKKSN